MTVTPITAIWLDVYEFEPPSYENILFLVDDCIHFGHMSGTEKVRKNLFYSDLTNCFYSADSNEPLDKRVTKWFPIPEVE